MSKPPVLECRSLSKTFHEGKLRVEVLKEINFSLHLGERVAIIGASGAGKSSFLHILGGLDQPTTGEVLLAGHNFSSTNEKQRSYFRNTYLGFVYQFHHLLPEFTALENVAMPLLLRGKAIDKVEKKASEVLAKLGLGNRCQHKLGELSGGERQRVAIARALVTHPLCVLADEPTGNLDRHNAEHVYQILLDLNRNFDTSLLIVTHDQNLAAKMDRILLLESGCLRPI